VNLIFLLLAVAAFPLACLGFLLWMTHLEDTLPAAVRKAVAEPDPPPIVAIPVRPGSRTYPVAPAIPVQRAESPQPAASQVQSAAPGQQTAPAVPPAAAGT
jgi:hypothetical protein